jgi:hypothetical protein
VSELTTLHEAIAATLRARMPKVKHVEAFPDLENEFGLPAVYFALTDITLGVDRGEGKTGLEGLFQACILVDPERNNASLQAAILATQVTAVLHNQYWGLDFITSPPERVHAQPDASAPELARFVVWVVEWTQHFEVGELEWPFEDEPGPIVWGFSPQTGTGHERDYVAPESLEPPQ